MSYREDIRALTEGLAAHSTDTLIQSMLVEIEESRSSIASTDVVTQADRLLAKIRDYEAGSADASECEEERSALVMSQEFDGARDSTQAEQQALYRYQSACVDLFRIVVNEGDIHLSAYWVEENLAEFKSLWMRRDKAETRRGSLARLSAFLDSLQSLMLSSAVIESRSRLSTMED